MRSLEKNLQSVLQPFAVKEPLKNTTKKSADSGPANLFFGVSEN